MRRFTTFGLFASLGLVFALTGCEPAVTPTDTMTPDAGISASPDPAAGVDSMPPATGGDSMAPIEPAPSVTPPATEPAPATDATTPQS